MLCVYKGASQSNGYGEGLRTLEREDLHHCLLPLQHYLLLPLDHYTLLPLLQLLRPGLLPCMGHPIKTTFTTTLQSPLSSLLPPGSTLSKRPPYLFTGGLNPGKGASSILKQEDPQKSQEYYNRRRGRWQLNQTTPTGNQTTRPQPDNQSRASCMEQKRQKATKSAEISRTLLTRTICLSEWSHLIISI